MKLTVTRREALVGGIATAICARYTPPAIGAASQPATAVDFDIPADACDCHSHIFCDSQRFPFWPGRTYTPEVASVRESLAVHRALHVTRIVVVNSLVYGVDNSCMLDALRQFGHRARGIALIDDTTSDAQLDTLQVAGVRGPTDLAPLLQIDDGRLLNQLPLWAPDSNVRRMILVENPGKLYGF